MRFHHMAVFVSNMEAAIRLWRDVLGFDKTGLVESSQRLCNRGVTDGEMPREITTSALTVLPFNASNCLNVIFRHFISVVGANSRKII